MESYGRQLSKNTKYAIVHALLGKKVRYQPVWWIHFKNFINTTHTHCNKCIATLPFAKLRPQQPLVSMASISILEAWKSHQFRSKCNGLFPNLIALYACFNFRSGSLQLISKLEHSMHHYQFGQFGQNATLKNLIIVLARTMFIFKISLDHGLIGYSFLLLLYSEARCGYNTKIPQITIISCYTIIRFFRVIPSDMNTFWSLLYVTLCEIT